MNQPKPQSRATTRLTVGLRTHFRTQRGCLYPEGPKLCGLPAINSHTVQRSTSLKAVSGTDFHVLTFYQVPKDHTGRPIPQKRGWKKASVFRGFCEKHDSGLFTPIETHPFTASSEQLFLVAYRAHCHELYQKLSMLDTEQLMRESNQPSLSKRFDDMYAGAKKACLSLERDKCFMDVQLVLQCYSGWSSAVFYLDGPLAVTGTGAITPNCDFEQNALQDLMDRSNFNQYLYFAITPCDGKVAFTFVWNSENEAPKRFVESLAQRPAAHVPSLLLQFVFAYCENTYFAEVWWNALDDQQRGHIRQLAGNPNPYYSPLEFKNEVIAPWSLDRLQLNI